MATTVLPGIVARGDFPDDGAAARDGTIHVLASYHGPLSRHASRDDLRLYTLRPRSATWDTTQRFNIESNGPSARIALDSDSTVVVYHGDRRSDGAVVVAIGGRLLPVKNRQLLTGGYRLSSGGTLSVTGRRHVIDTGARAITLPFHMGRLLGADDRGRSYYSVASSGVYVECYAPDGRLLARDVPSPHVRGRGHFEGKGEVFVAPQGGLVALRLGDDGLQVIRLTVPD